MENAVSQTLLVSHMFSKGMYAALDRKVEIMNLVSELCAVLATILSPLDPSHRNGCTILRPLLKNDIVPDVRLEWVDHM